ncbi:MAG: hypothetical protein ACRDJH_04645 [Thermomicrobiales bacterium]
MGKGSFRVVDADAEGRRGTTVIATGAGRADAVEAALTGILAASGGGDRAHDASVAIPLRAERPDLISLVQALVAQLADEARESGAAVGGLRLDGLLRTDDGLTAWGYAFVTPNLNTTLDVPEVADVAVTEERGQTTITVTLAPTSSVHTR